MKILIGITQDLKAARTTISSKYKGLGVSTEAGPFKTREEALNWQNFMMNRNGDYEELKALPTSAQEAYWFGITIESHEIH